jgi:putative membrane protein
MCLFIGVLTVLPILPSLHGLLLSLVVGVILFLLAMLSDFAIYLSGLKNDPVFNLRRCSALSLYSNLLWILFILLGGFSYIFLNDFSLWLRLSFLGLCVIIVLRLLVFSAISFASGERIVLYSILQPGLYAMPVVVIAGVKDNLFASSTLFFLASSLSVGVLATFCFIFSLNRMGTKILGVKSLSVLKVFMANWTEDLNEPLENLLESLSVERSIKLSVIMFRTRGKVKAAMVVPAFHPGPFKNVGSSALPYLIQKELENKLKCIVSVPHGISGHDLDLASQAQNQKIIQKISKMVDASNFDSTATPLMRGQKNGAHASCQIFGECALFTLTLAPQTMEDLPQSLESFIAEEARKRGLSMAITIDAHNSIEGPFHVKRAVAPLKEAAAASLEAALKSQKSSLQVGAANFVPPDFSLKEGMGPGGICAIAVKVKDQLIAYITVDGNNMVSGLRETILRRLNEMGFSDGEVLTTDTHAVNGIVLTPRGYHPLGEAIEQEKLVEYIEQTATNAKNDLEPAEAAWFAKIAPNVRVIGEKQVERLCVLAEKAFLRAKRLASIIFPLVGLIWAALLIFLS